MGQKAHRSRKRTRQERRKREGNGGKPRREREEGAARSSGGRQGPQKEGSEQKKKRKKEERRGEEAKEEHNRSSLQGQHCQQPCFAKLPASIRQASSSKRRVHCRANTGKEASEWSDRTRMHATWLTSKKCLPATNAVSPAVSGLLDPPRPSSLPRSESALGCRVCAALAPFALLHFRGGHRDPHTELRLRQFF